MKAQLQYVWIKDVDFNDSNPLTCKVVDIVLGGKDNQEKILQFSVGDKLRQISIYAQNWNTFVTKFGDETDNWKGKTFRLLQFLNAGDNKKIKCIEV